MNIRFDEHLMKIREQEDKRVAEALAKVGVHVSSVYDLVNTGKPYPEAIPVLIKLLSEVRDNRIKEGVVRALTVKEARGVATKPLIAEFKNVRPDEHGAESLKWAIGNALSVVADDSVFEELVELVKDRRHGRARQMLAIALGNMKNSQADDILIELLNDDDVGGHAIVSLGKRRAKKARPQIERFLSHEKTWIRKEAKQAIARIDKAGQRKPSRG